ncbi:MAG: hypothetical protein Kow0025_11830 [Thermodesulfovibrionales bacterium]
MKRFSPRRLLARRKELGLTQAALSEKARLSTVSLSAMENGKKEPRAGTLARLSEALETGVEYFFE